MTVPTLILIGERDDWAPAQECRNMVDGRDDWGISRSSGEGAPVRLVVYPGAYHAFDVPGPADAGRIPRASPRIQQIGGGSGEPRRCANFFADSIGEKAKAP